MFISLIKGLAFRGDDESCCSLNKGNFLELISLRSNELQILKDNHEYAYVNSKVQNEIIELIAAQVKQKI